MTAVLPIFIIIILLGGYVWVKSGLKRYMNVKMTHWLLTVYIGVLLLSLAATPFLKEVRHLKEKDQLSAIDAGSEKLGEYLSTGRLDKIDEQYLIGKKTFDLKSDKLNLQTQASGFSGQVFIERSSNLKGKVEVLTYSGTLLVDGLDFSKMLRPHQFELTGNTLKIIAPYQKIKLAFIANSYPARQIAGETVSNHGSFTSNMRSYLIIPETTDLQIDGNIMFENVNKEE